MIYDTILTVHTQICTAGCIFADPGALLHITKYEIPVIQPFCSVSRAIRCCKNVTEERFVIVVAQVPFDRYVTTSLAGQ